MPLHSVGRRARTISNASLKIGGMAILNERVKTNICPPFSQWSLSGTASVINGVLTLPNSSAYAVSPLMPTEQSAMAYFSAEWYSDIQSVYAPFQPDAARLLSSNYYAADKVTPALNTSGYTGNGNAVKFPKSIWRLRSETGGYWSTPVGPNIYWVKIAIQAQSYVGTPEQVRLPQLTCGPITSSIWPYAPYYRAGLEA